jgi:hypothetical protein
MKRLEQAKTSFILIVHKSLLIMTRSIANGRVHVQHFTKATEHTSRN